MPQLAMLRPQLFYLCRWLQTGKTIWEHDVLVFPLDTNTAVAGQRDKHFSLMVVLYPGKENMLMLHLDSIAGTHRQCLLLLIIQLLYHDPL